MQPSYYFSGLLCVSKTNTQVHNHSVPALYSRLERKRGSAGGNSCRKSFKAKRTSSELPKDIHSAPMLITGTATRRASGRIYNETCREECPK